LIFLGHPGEIFLDFNEVESRRMDAKLIFGENSMRRPADDGR